MGANIVEVICPACVASVTPTVSTTPAYSSGDAVGGLQTIGNAARTLGQASPHSSTTQARGTTILQSITIIETGSQKAALGIVIFNGNPSASTVTDNTALAINSADIAKVVGYVPITAGDYVTVSTVSLVSKTVGLVLPLGTDLINLFAAVVTTGTPTYSTTGSLIFRYGFLQN